MTPEDYALYLKEKFGEERTRDGMLIRDMNDKELVKRVLTRYPKDREKIVGVEEYLGEDAPPELPKSELQQKVESLPNLKFINTGAPNLGNRTAGIYQGAAKKITDSISLGTKRYEDVLNTTDGGTLGGQAQRVGTLLETGLGAAAGGAQAVFAPFTAVLQEAMSAVPQEVQADIATYTSPITKPLQEWAQKNPRVATDLMDAITVAGAISTAGGGAKNPLNTDVGKLTASVADDAGTQISNALQTAAPVVEKTVNEVAKNTSRMTQNMLTRSKQIVSPSPTPEKAVGEILQGQTKDIKKGIKALTAIDTKGVKTFEELKNRLDAGIKAGSEQVDEVLARDTSLTKLNNLASKTVTQAGKTVSRNYVDDALRHLKELYTKTADDAGLSDIDELLTKANKVGLTKQEVNDIARIYSEEFGEKAFSKVGDPLTSVNAQMYENIRRGVKAKAREGLGGGAAAEIDRTTAAMYNTRKLISKNVEAVQKLTQRIEERSLLEQIGYGAMKTADVLTGGTLRGIVGGLLPRGVGYKVLNALDLEKLLERNLKVINEALKAGSDEAIVSAVKTLSAPAP